MYRCDHQDPSSRREWRHVFTVLGLEMRLLCLIHLSHRGRLLPYVVDWGRTVHCGTSVCGGTNTKVEFRGQSGPLYS